MIRIAIFTALPQEHALFRRKTPPWETVQAGPVGSYRKIFSDRECILTETGMGRRGIERALDWAYRGTSPDLILSAGFAGSLDPRFEVGEVFLGEQFLVVRGASALGREDPALSCPAGPTLAAFARTAGLRRVRVATVEAVQGKPALCERLGGASTLVEMETYFTAMTAAKRETPFLSIRSVSDGLGDAIDFDVAALSDADGRVLVSRVIQQIVRSPRLLASLLSAWKRSRLAASSLAAVLRAFFSLPSEDLERIIHEQRVSILTSPEG